MMYSSPSCIDGRGTNTRQEPTLVILLRFHCKILGSEILLSVVGERQEITHQYYTLRVRCTPLVYLLIERRQLGYTRGTVHGRSLRLVHSLGSACKVRLKSNRVIGL